MQMRPTLCVTVLDIAHLAGTPHTRKHVQHLRVMENHQPICLRLRIKLGPPAVYPQQVERARRNRDPGEESVMKSGNPEEGLCGGARVFVGFSVIVFSQCLSIREVRSIFFIPTMTTEELHIFERVMHEICPCC